MIQVQLKLQLRPAQERQLNRLLWHLTGVYNWTLKKLEADARYGLYHSLFDLNNLLVGHSARIGISSNALYGTAATAHNAWKRYCSGLARKPKLKGRRNRLNSIAFARGGELRIHGRRVNVPLLGRVKFHEQDIPTGHVGYARIVHRASGWYVCLFVHAESSPIPHVAGAQVGIDPGFMSLLTLSTGEKVEHPRELQRTERRIGQAQRGGRRSLVARLRERQARLRRDRNHKLSRRLVAENALIAWSADQSSNLARTFGKSVTSSAHSQLRRMLAYKSRSGGRRYVEVSNRYSTMTCAACGARSGPTGYAGLSVRQWTCGCGAMHDRDCNAAVNTLHAALGTSVERTGNGSSRNRPQKQHGEVQLPSAVETNTPKEQP